MYEANGRTWSPQSLQCPRALDVPGACKSTLKLSPILPKCPVRSKLLPGSQVDVSVPCSLLNPVFTTARVLFQSPKPKLNQTRQNLTPAPVLGVMQRQWQHRVMSWGDSSCLRPQGTRVGWNRASPAEIGSSKVSHGSNHSSTQSAKGLAEKGVGLCQSSSCKGPVSSQPQASGHPPRG